MAEPYDGSDPTRCNMLKLGKYCRNGAGKGTNHKGYGYCKKHAGNSPSLVKHAMKLKAADECRRLAIPVDIGPQEALLQEVRRTAGWVAFYEERLAALSQTHDLVTGKPYGATGDDDPTDGRIFEVKACRNQLMENRQHLTTVAKTAIACGLLEHHVKMMERQGKMLVEAVTGMLVDLGHNPADPEVRRIVRGRILELSVMPQLTEGEQVIEGEVVSG